MKGQKPTSRGKVPSSAQCAWQHHPVGSHRMSPSPPGGRGERPKADQPGQGSLFSAVVEATERSATSASEHSPSPLDGRGGEPSGFRGERGAVPVCVTDACLLPLRQRLTGRNRITPTQPPPSRRGRGERPKADQPGQGSLFGAVCVATPPSWQSPHVSLSPWREG